MNNDPRWNDAEGFRVPPNYSGPPPQGWRPPAPQGWQRPVGAPQQGQYPPLTPPPVSKKPKKTGKILLASGAAIFLLGIGGCLGSSGESAVPAPPPASPSQPAPTTAAPTTSAPAPETTKPETKEPTKEPTKEETKEAEPEPDLEQEAMDMAWDTLSEQEQADVCILWAVDPDSVIDAFESGAGEGTFPRSEVKKFFRSKCE